MSNLGYQMKISFDSEDNYDLYCYLPSKTQTLTNAANIASMEAIAIFKSHYREYMTKAISFIVILSNLILVSPILLSTRLLYYESRAFCFLFEL